MEGLFEFSPLVIATIPVALGLVQVIKTIGVPSKYAPILSLALGMLLVALTGAGWQIVIAQGLIVGLAAAGLWSGGKTTLKGMK